MGNSENCEISSNPESLVLDQWHYNDCSIKIQKMFKIRSNKNVENGEKKSQKHLTTQKCQCYFNSHSGSSAENHLSFS